MLQCYGCGCFEARTRSAAQTKSHAEVQDEQADGWKHMLDLIEAAAADASEEFAPLDEMSLEAQSQVITLPASIAKLKAVRRLQLYGSHLVRDSTGNWRDGKPRRVSSVHVATAPLVSIRNYTMHSACGQLREHARLVRQSSGTVRHFQSWRHPCRQRAVSISTIFRRNDMARPPSLRAASVEYPSLPPDCTRSGFQCWSQPMCCLCSSTHARLRVSRNFRRVPATTCPARIRAARRYDSRVAVSAKWVSRRMDVILRTSSPRRLRQCRPLA